MTSETLAPLDPSTLTTTDQTTLTQGGFVTLVGEINPEDIGRRVSKQVGALVWQQYHRVMPITLTTRAALSYRAQADYLQILSRALIAVRAIRGPDVLPDAARTTETGTRGHVSTRESLRLLSNLLALPADWDGEGSPPPSDVAAHTAHRIIDTSAERFGTIAGQQALPYDVAPIPGGGVGLEWRNGPRKLQLWIDVAGRVGFLMVDRATGGRISREGDSVSLPHALELIAEVILR